MPRNIFLEIEYEGTAYYGFQVQSGHPDQVSLQDVLEQAIERLFAQKIRVIYSGRTDRGVHALGQCLNFHTDKNIPLKNIKTALNNILPADVRIKKIKAVPQDFHARFSAKSKIYRYLISTAKEPSVFQRNLVWHIPEPLDLGLMRRAAVKLIGKKDFFLFAFKSARYEHCVRRIIAIKIIKKGSRVSIDIEADGFLRNMARNIARFLVDVACGNLAVNDVPAAIKGKILYTKHPAPAAGLYLLKVKYG